ncbi:thioesterase domain-containing protein [soil metagenome]
MTTEKLTYRSRDGLSIEAELDAPPDEKAALVLCHPHPKMGGTMHAPLLLALRDELCACGWTVLRFNFRGIGASEGEPSLGAQEVDDAIGAVALLRERAQERIAIAGWSFGAAVAVRAAAEDDSLVGCVGIAPAVRPQQDVTIGLPRPDELDLGVPLLFVCGANDEVVSAAECRDWVAAFDHGDYVEMASANHFFWGRYDKLTATVAGWLDERVRGRPPQR